MKVKGKERLKLFEERYALGRRGSTTPQAVLEGLYAIRAYVNDGEKVPTNGLCGWLGNLAGSVPTAMKFIAVYSRSWKHYSGCHDYPVPAPAGCFIHLGPRQGSYYAYNNLPRWEGQYGALRCMLLDHLINELEADLAAAED